MNTIREMTIEDYEAVLALWNTMEGLSLSEADSQPNLEQYLARNRGLSFVCVENDLVIGSILAGHDGRRGFIYHLAVNPAYRKRRIGQQLVDLSLQGLQAQGITKCHIFVMEDNAVGQSFWSASGWEKRSGFFVYSKDL